MYELIVMGIFMSISFYLGSKLSKNEPLVERKSNIEVVDLMEEQEKLRPVEEEFEDEDDLD
jgi:hypothetical protein